MRDAGLKQAIQAAGGISALARALGVSQPSASNWSRVPAERVLAVEAFTSVPRYVLRPDLYPVVSQDDAIDDIDLTRGKLYLLLANLLREPPPEIVLMELAAYPSSADDTPLSKAMDNLAEAARHADAQVLERDHFHLFIGVGRADFLPYASFYRTGFLYERPLVNVREDMRVLGIARAGDVREPEDSIAFLCEAMAGMALKRFTAAPEFERRFFERHLAPWAEQFFRDLAANERSGFYRAVGAVGGIFIGLEIAGFEIDSVPVSGDADQHRRAS